MLVRWCEDVATILAIQPRLTYRWVEEEQVHYVEREQGALIGLLRLRQAKQGIR